MSGEEADTTPGSSLRTPGQPSPADLGALYVSHHITLSKIAAATLPGWLHHCTDEALMTVFERLARHKQDGALLEPDSWEAYLITAVRNACLDIIKAASGPAAPAPASTEAWSTQPPGRPRRQREPVAEDLDPTGDAATAGADWERDRPKVQAAFEQLPERTRDIIQRTLDEQSNVDIGRDLGITGQRVGQIFKAGLQAMRGAVTQSDG